jgi:hypothetical protein
MAPDSFVEREDDEPPEKFSLREVLFIVFGIACIVGIFLLAHGYDVIVAIIFKT